MRFSIAILLLFALLLPLSALSNEGGQLPAGQLFLTALQSRQTGETAKADSALRQVVKSEAFPLKDYAQFEIGQTLYSAGNYSAAQPEFQRLINDHPQSILLPRAALMVGKCYFNQKNYRLAIKTFASLVDTFPDAKEAAEARYLTARALEKEKKWQAAYAAYEETDLYHPLTYFGKQSRLAIKGLKKAHKKNLLVYKASAAALFKKGMAYFDQDDYQMAANIFNRLAREYPKSKYVMEAWLMLGRAELLSNNPSAIADLERATSGPPNLAGRAHYYLGQAYGRRGKYQKAIASMKKVADNYPESGLADDALYWAAYYQEIDGDKNGALKAYYDMITRYPYSNSVSAAVWRIGKIYYWGGDFKNAATYLHMAQLYPPGEDSPRCYFFEAKALERQGNQAAALEVYKKLAERYDHTYYAYRAQEKLRSAGISALGQTPFSGEEFNEAIGSLDEKNEQELASIMEIWEQTNTALLESESSEEARVHLTKYKELMNLGLAGYAADEARYLVNITSDVEKETAQTKLGEMLIQAGNYKTPIRFADRKVKEAIMAGKTQALPKKIWQLSYPKGYWKHVAGGADNFKVDPYLVLAVIREESRFSPKAVSRSGARGLMQIMPRTGLGIAKDLDLPRYRTRKLYEPASNVKMGSYYLSNLIKSFSNNVYLALAGYNGGPNKIKRYVKTWYNGDLGMVDIDEFVESIPSRETRLYVQKVMGSYFEYKRLYDRKRG